MQLQTGWKRVLAPDRIIATGKKIPGVKRPLCPYPKYPHYKGAGDINAAENFECRGGF
jgi:feruloyl esterase